MGREVMRLLDMIYAIEGQAYCLGGAVEKTGELPDDAKSRLQYIRRTCNRILMGEYEVEGTDDADD